MKTFFLGSAFFLVAFFLSSEPVNAHGPCRAEVEKYCPGMARGPELRACVQKNKDLFSQECRNHWEKKRAAWQACKDDKQKFCASVQPGEGRVKACLRQHEAELSPSCRGVVERPKS